MNTPRYPVGDTLVANSSGTCFASYGPRRYDGPESVESCAPADANIWGVYEWSEDELPGGMWQWVADCATADHAELLASALTQGA